MTRIQRFAVAAVAVASIVLTATANAANVQAGAAKAKEVCASCHGMDGNSPSPDFPKLAGQPADYLAHSLRAYKDGRRKNPIMTGFASALTVRDIDNLSAYYAAQPPVLFVEPYTHRAP